MLGAAASAAKTLPGERRHLVSPPGEGRRFHGGGGKASESLPSPWGQACCAAVNEGRATFPAGGKRQGKGERAGGAGHVLGGGGKGSS